MSDLVTVPIANDNGVVIDVQVPREIAPYLEAVVAKAAEARPEAEVKAEALADAVLAIRSLYPADETPDPLTEEYGVGLSDAVLEIDRIQKALRGDA